MQGNVGQENLFLSQHASLTLKYTYIFQFVRITTIFQRNTIIELYFVGWAFSFLRDIRRQFMVEPLCLEVHSFFFSDENELFKEGKKKRSNNMELLANDIHQNEKFYASVFLIAVVDVVVVGM